LVVSAGRRNRPASGRFSVAYVPRANNRERAPGRRLRTVRLYKVWAAA